MSSDTGVRWDCVGPYEIEIEPLEMLQHRAVQSIANLKDGKHALNLVYSLSNRICRLSLPVNILQDKERHSTLGKAQDEITRDRQQVTITTESASRLHRDTMVASCQEPSETPLKILVNKRNTENTNTINQLLTAVTHILTKIIHC